MFQNVVFYNKLKLHLQLQRIFLIFPAVRKNNNFFPSQNITVYSFTFLFIYCVFSSDTIWQVSVKNPQFLEFLLSTGYLWFFIQSLDFIIGKLSTIIIVMLAAKYKLFMIEFYHNLLCIDEQFYRKFDKTNFQDGIQRRTLIGLRLSITYVSCICVFAVTKLTQLGFLNWFTIVGVPIILTYDLLLFYVITVGYVNCIDLLKTRFEALEEIISRVPNPLNKDNLVHVLRLHGQLFKGINLLNQSYGPILAIRFFHDFYQLTMGSYTTCLMIIDGRIHGIISMVFFAGPTILKMVSVFWFCHKAIRKVIF